MISDEARYFQEIVLLWSFVKLWDELQYFSLEHVTLMSEIRAGGGVIVLELLQGIKALLASRCPS